MRRARRLIDPVWLLVRTFVVYPLVVILCVLAALILAILHFSQTKGP